MISRALQAIIVLQYLGLLTLSNAAANSSGEHVIPLAMVVPPSQRWEGNDGPWSTFFLRVGTPVQALTVLISTASNQALVILPEGCPSSGAPTCATSRGGLFQSNTSSTWTKNNMTEQGIYTLAMEKKLNITTNALYGTDTIGLGLPGTGTTSLDNQLVGGIASTDFFMGSFGLKPASTNFSDFNHPIPSYMANLKSQNKIPSLSYGYTAGNQYRFNKVLGSLTLGGYDASLIVSNNLTIAFNGNSNLDLTINVNSISFSSNSTKKSLSPSWFPAYIDSTVPYLYLPLEVCDRFEEAFGITYDDASGLYLVNDTLHSQLLKQNANVTFTLTNVTSQVLVDIVLPYQAFDLVADIPLVETRSRYFPLKRAKDNSQTVLGRAFLQEAYLIADYERSSFSISQRNWDANAKEDTRIILPPSNPVIDDSSSPNAKSGEGNNTLRHHVSTAIIIAAVVGGTVLVTILLGCAIIIRQRHRKLRALQTQQPLPLTIIPQEVKSLAQSQSDILSPTYTYRTELDVTRNWEPSVEFERVPDLPPVATIPAQIERPGRQIVYELPAEATVRELVGSPVYSGPILREARHNQSYEEHRRQIRARQNSRRQRLIRDSP